MRVLYLSYDGMTDPLGQSQVIPYLTGLTDLGHRFHLVSFEKDARMAEHGDRVRAQLRDAGIQWHPLRYTKRPPILSTAWDVVRMRRMVTQLHRAERFDLVHCRSYVTSVVGLGLKRRAHVPFLFDMRGFWAEERVDGGLWDLGNPVFRAVFNYTKRLEARFLRHADGIVCLTNAGRSVLDTLVAPADARVAVIPCSVDFERFVPATAEGRLRARADVGLADDALVVAYLGSIGTWYLLEEMLAWFATLRKREPMARLLFITPEPPAAILARAAAYGIATSDVVVRFVPYRDVPAILDAADVGLFFIKSGRSKLGSSPTKLGEYLAKGIPVVANAGVGDVAEVVRQARAGVVLTRLGAAEYAHVAAGIRGLVALDRARIRRAARDIYDIDNAVRAYDALYARCVLHASRARGHDA